MNDGLRIGSLFSGVGGFDLGLERAGHKVEFQVEADPYRREVLARHFPGAAIYDDVRTFDEPYDVDLICGGFPCQDLSLAGKRAGLAGNRSGLFFECARIADSILGDGGWLLIENTLGLLSSNRGRDFGVVLASLAERGFYDLAWRCVDSRYFGVPQRRRRVFLLARRSRGRRSAEVLLKSEGRGRNSPEGRKTRSNNSRTPGNGIAGTLDQRNGGADVKDAQANHLVIDGPTVDSDGMRTSTRVSRRLDGPSVTAFHATQDPITSKGFTPTFSNSAAIGIMAEGLPKGSTCAVDPKPDSRRYAAMGDAVTVNVAEWIGRRLREFG